MQPNNDYFMAAEDFAARHELTTEAVIKMIRYKVLGGRLFNEHWFIDLTSRRTQMYLNTRNTGGTSGASIAQALRIIGKIAIGFGGIAGIALLISFSQPTSFLFVQSKAELNFEEIAVIFGITLFYCVLGVICLGFAKLIELSDK